MQDVVHSIQVEELLFRFVRDGWLADADQVGLACFSAPEIDPDLADMSGDLKDHHLFSFERNFASRRRAIGTEVKLYFYANEFRTNGLRLLDKFRLTTFLKHLRLKDEGAAFDIFLSGDGKEGAVLFRNGVLIQFFCLSPRANFYISTVESGVDLTDVTLAKAANQRYVASMFHTWSREKCNMKQYAKHRPVRKLCSELQKFP